MATPRHDRRRLKRLLGQLLGEEFDPVVEMARNASYLQKRITAAVTSEEIVDPDDFARYVREANEQWDKVAPYVNPKMKSVEVDGDISGDFVATIRWRGPDDTDSVQGSGDTE